jgi:hypothetical protein
MTGRAPPTACLTEPKKSAAPAEFSGKFPRLRVRAGIDGPNPEGRSTGMKVKTNVKAGEWLMSPAGQVKP